MLLAVAPEQAEAAFRVVEHGIGLDFAIQSQAVDESGVCGKENVVRRSIFNLLRQGGAGLGNEPEVDCGVIFAKRTGKVRL